MKLALNNVNKSFWKFLWVFNFSLMVFRVNASSSLSCTMNLESQDSTFTQVTHFGIGAGIFSSRQLNVSLIFKLNRHLLEIGMIYGPSFTFSIYNSTEATTNKYLVKEKLDFNNFNIHGGNFSYQFLLLSNKRLENKLIAFTEYSIYQGTYYIKSPEPFPPTYFKRQLHLLLGYGLSLNLSKKLILDICILPGVKYYWDKILLDVNSPPSNPPGPREYYWEKLLPSFVGKIGVTYNII